MTISGRDDGRGSDSTDGRRGARWTTSTSLTPANASPPRSSTSTRSDGSTSRRRSRSSGTRTDGHRVVHARLLPAGLRPLHRAHDDEPEARHQEEPQGAAAEGALSGRQRQDLLPEGLPAAARALRARLPRSAHTARVAASSLRTTTSGEGVSERGRRCPMPAECDGVLYTPRGHRVDGRASSESRITAGPRR